MRKLLLTAVCGLLGTACLGVGYALLPVNAGESEAKPTNEVVYENDGVMDIAEYMTTDAFTEKNGVLFENGDVVFSRAASAILNDRCGISFVTKFAGNGWAEKGSKEFRIALGANEILCSLNGGVLKLNVYNRERSESIAGQYVKAVALEGFDSTKAHKWEISRTKSTDEGYSLQLRIDVKPVVDVQDDASAISVYSNDKIEIVNNTGVNVTVYSALEETLSFEEERNVFDVLDFSGNKKLLTWDGVWLNDGDALIDEESLSAYADANGFQWRMRAKSVWAKDVDKTVLAFTFGNTDVSLSYDPSTQAVYAAAYTKWTDENGVEQTLGGKELVMENYSPTEWHTWRIVNVKSSVSDGYATRFIVDGAQRLQMYTRNGFSEEFSQVYFENQSGTDVCLRSAYYTVPLLEAERCEDIVALGASAALKEEAGVTVASGESVMTLSDQQAATETAGIEFVMQSLKEWENDGETKVQVTFGASEILFKTTEDNKLALSVKNNAHSLGAWTYAPTEINFSEKQSHTVKITRRKFIAPNGENNQNGFTVAVYIDGVKVLENIEVLSPMWKEGFKSISIVNRSACDMVFQSTKLNVDIWETLPY